MTRAKGLKDRWIRAVLSSQLNNAAKLVCIALSVEMSDSGRVTANRADIAEAVGWETKQRVTDRIKEARDAGFLSIVGGGKNGRPVTYDAMIPGPNWQAGTPLRGTPGNGSRGTSTGYLNPAVEAAQVPHSGVPIRARGRVRATKTNRECTPAPDDGRVEREHDVTSQAGTYGIWQPTPVADASSDSTEDVA